MFGWLRQKESKTIPENKNKNPNDEKERNFVSNVMMNFENAESVKTCPYDDSSDYSIEDEWDDDDKMFKGGGEQWKTTIAYRTKKARKIRPNSETNHVFSTVRNQHANITVNTPEVAFHGVEDGDEEIAEKLTCATKHNDNRNNFKATWKKLVMDFLKSGPTILEVQWDSEWMGGRGENRWVGDVRINRIKKKDFYPDPAILDLETDMQNCSFVITRSRTKLSYINKRWKNGKYVTEEVNTDENQHEGSDPQQAYLHMYWHRGFPNHVPEDRAEELRTQAMALEEKEDYYKAQDYYDAAKGDIEGVHVAYVANGVLLEYIPYIYEHGEYPFVYCTKHFDDDNPWGYGEIRNLKIPQIMANKADEIIIEGSSRQGLGGFFYQEDALTESQLRNILENSSKGGMCFPVNSLHNIKEREPVNVPSSLANYRDSKQMAIENISQVTPIQKGMASNMPYRAIAELGERTDVVTKQAVEKLEDFLKKVNQLRIALFAQFYTENRYYRIKGSNGKTKEGMINADEMFLEWTRDVIINEETGEEQELKEKFIPEFDITITILSEKPTDRNYYTQVALDMNSRGLMTGEDLWYTLEEGKFPPMSEILKNIEAQNMAAQVTNLLTEVPSEVQQQLIQNMQLDIQNIQQQAMQQQQQNY